MLNALHNTDAFIRRIPIISWVYAWMVWWTLLPFRVMKLGWHFKKVALMIIFLMIMSAAFHDHTNTISFHGFGPIRFALVGLMNFFWGTIDSVLHFGADAMSIPFQKMNGCPPDKFFIGWVIGCVVHLYFWAIPESLMYWFVNHILSPEFLWGIIVVGIVYSQILPGGKGSSHSPPKPAASGGGHGH